MISDPVRIRVWGPWACFTRPEFKVERVSYPVMTPSAARGVLEAILMKPMEKPETHKRGDKLGFRWHILRIGIVEKGTLVSILRNELGYSSHGYSGYDINDAKKVRTQRHSLILKGPARNGEQRPLEYVIEAAIEVPGPIKRIGAEFQAAKYRGMFERRARQGQCFHRPYLGCREYPCDFEWAPEAEPPASAGTEDFGMMLRDLDFDPLWDLWPSGQPRPESWKMNGEAVTPRPEFFNAHSENGWICVARLIEESGRRKVVPCDR